MGSSTAHDLAGAEHLEHLGLDGAVQAADLAAAAGEQHAVLQALLELGVEGCDQLAQALDDGRHDASGRRAQLGRDVERSAACPARAGAR